MKSYILQLDQLSRDSVEVAGVKAANLGELLKTEGTNVPDGFCITAEAFKSMVWEDNNILELIGILTETEAGDKDRIYELCNEIRSKIENVNLHDELKKSIVEALKRFQEDQFYAIRSSATGEDLPEASFAGQQDTYLNISGVENIIEYTRKCWASLFTDRAVIYRIENGFDHRNVTLSVIVQKMVFPEAAGIMFTADPMTSDRMTITIDAGYGLGEGIVSGQVDPDIYKLAEGKIIQRSIGIKNIVIVPVEDGGVIKKNVEEDLVEKQVLVDKDIEKLAELGLKIQKHFGIPQDIEWSYQNGEYYILQSRPITTIFPLPNTSDREENRIYMSIGHTQMMTDAIRPLGTSFFSMISEVSMDIIGGRIYTDITHDLSSPIGRKRLVMASGKQDPLIQASIKRVLDNKALMDSLPKGKRNVQGGIFTLGSIIETLKVYRKNNIEFIDKSTKEFDVEIENLNKKLTTLSGDDVMEYMVNDKKNLLRMAYDNRILGAIIASIFVSESIDKRIEKLTGEKNVSDVLLKSLDHNVTTEMGFMLSRISDIARKNEKVIEYLEKHEKDDNFLDGLKSIPGGEETRDALDTFLQRFGMRCPGEIDITRDRFVESPTKLIPIILNNIRVLKEGEYKERFDTRRNEALTKKKEILEIISKTPGGKRKAKKLEKNIDLLRNFSGCREDPKYYIVKRFMVYKRAILKEAELLVQKGKLEKSEDIFYLYIHELRDVIRGGNVDYTELNKRKTEFQVFEKLTPPRIFTSKGYVPKPDITVENLPEGAMPGIPVSSGIIEGRARVVLSINNAKVDEGDILVTRFTDPSWTPLFSTISGLVTEVGGFTTHGAIVAREYGLPSVVGVQNATTLIKDGQSIRVNGSEGYVEIIN